MNDKITFITKPAGWAYAVGTSRLAGRKDGYQLAELTTTGTDATDLFSFALEADAVYFVEAWVLGVDSDDYGNQAGGRFHGVFERDGNTTAQVGATQGTVLESAGGTNIAFAVDDSNDYVKLQVTGTASTAGFKWRGGIRIFKQT